MLRVLCILLLVELHVGWRTMTNFFLICYVTQLQLTPISSLRRVQSMFDVFTTDMD